MYFSYHFANRAEDGSNKQQWKEQWIGTAVSICHELNS
jgi:hypothetical protein